MRVGFLDSLQVQESAPASRAAARCWCFLSPILASDHHRAHGLLNHQGRSFLKCIICGCGATFISISLLLLLTKMNQRYDLLVLS